MFGKLKKLFVKIIKLDNYVTRYKTNGIQISMPSFAYMNWGVKLLDEGKKEEALKMLEKSINMPYLNSESYVNLGSIYLQLQDYEKSLESLKKAIRLDNNNAKAYQILGSLYCEISEYENAQKSFNTAIKLSPRNPQIYLNRAIFYAKTKQWKKADDDFKKACQLSPANPHVWFLWGVLSVELKQYDDAYEKLQQSISLSPDNPDAYYHLTSIDFARKYYTSAIINAKKTLALDDKRQEVYIILAESWFNLNNESKCLSVFETAEKKINPDFEFYYSWGAIFQHYNKWNDSLLKFKKAYEMNPKSAKVTNAMAISYLKINNEDEGKNYLLKTVEIEPNHTIALFNLGQYFARKCDYKNAIEYFKKAVSTDMSAKGIYINIATMYDFLLDDKNSLEYWKKAVEYNPDNNAAKINLVNAYVKNGDIQSAIRKIRVAYKENKNNKRMLVLYGILLSETNDFYNALEKFDEALKIDSEYVNAKCAKIECLIRMNKLDNAQKLLSSIEENKEKEGKILFLKMTLNYAYIENQNRLDLVGQTKDICDRILSNHMDDICNLEKVNIIKEKLADIKEN